MVVSIFGESDEDRRDYGYAFGAFKGTAYLGLVLAGQGLLSPLDAKELRRQMMDGIGIVPPSQLSSAGRAAIEEALESVETMAGMNFKPGK
jgi:hypothetical protein